jgi:hypothetical protein
MTGFNLPDGCEVHHLPGNRPEDEAFEKLVEEAIERIEELLQLLVAEIDEYEGFDFDTADVLDAVFNEYGYVPRPKKGDK